MKWWKKPWPWIWAVLAFVGSVLVFLFTAGRRGRVTINKPEGLKAPRRPKTPDVSVPEKRELNTNVADDYNEDKKTADNIHDAIASVNSRYE